MADRKFRIDQLNLTGIKQKIINSYVAVYEFSFGWTYFTLGHMNKRRTQLKSSIILNLFFVLKFIET